MPHTSSSAAVLQSATACVRRARASNLFTPRTAVTPPEPRLFVWIDRLVLLLYSAVLAFAIPHHIAFDDEAQAWLLARDNSLHVLLLHWMHYEGAPGLWPTILWLAVRLHLPFAAISWIGGAFAVAGVAILVTRSPFPPIFRWLLPFTFFLQFQYAVIARPYALFPALLFSLCVLFHRSHPGRTRNDRGPLRGTASAMPPTPAQAIPALAPDGLLSKAEPIPRPARPLAFAIIAGLLVNVSLHAAIVGGILSLVYCWQFRPSAKAPRSSPKPRQLAFAAGVFLLFAVVSAGLAFPAPDVVNIGDSAKPFARPDSFLARLMPPPKLPHGAPPLDPPLDFTTYHERKIAAKSGGITPKPPPGILLVLVRTVVFGADAACFPIARNNLLDVAFLACFFFWLRSRSALRFALPWGVAIVLSVNVLVLDHHSGQFALALLAAAWLALDSAVLNRPRSPQLPILLSFLSLLIVVLQIGWTIHSLAFERTHSYDPGKETASFLKRDFAGKRIAGFAYDSVSTQPYAPQSLFFNQPNAFWLWSAPVFADRRRTEVLQAHPDAIVQGDVTVGDDVFFNQWGKLSDPGDNHTRPMIEFWQLHGFHITHTFCGQRPMRLGFSDSFCEVILEPNPAAVP